MAQHGKSLYMAIYTKLLEQIRAGTLKAGDKLVSEHEFARELDANRLTVRRAYKMLLEDGYAQSFQGKGTFLTKMATELYVPKPNIGGVFHNITLVFPDSTFFFSAFLKTFEALAAKNGYLLNVIVNDTLLRETSAIDILVSNIQTDGVILSPLRNTKNDSVANYQKLLSAGIPVVMIGKLPLGLECDCVYCYDVYMCYKALKHCLEKGCKSVLYIYNSTDDIVSVQERHDGFELAVSEYNYVHSAVVDVREPNYIENVCNTILREKVDVIFSTSEYAALQVNNMLLERHIKCPEIICFLATDITSKLNLNLHTLEVPKTEMAKAAFDMLNQIICSGEALRNNFSMQAVFQPRFTPIT